MRYLYTAILALALFSCDGLNKKETQMKGNWLEVSKQWANKSVKEFQNIHGEPDGEFKSPWKNYMIYNDLWEEKNGDIKNIEVYYYFKEDVATIERIQLEK